jgi:single-strand DNA-binding protein
VTVFGQRAETYAQSLRKGSRVYVDGRLEARPWTDQQGQVRAGLELVVSDIMNITSRDTDERMSGEGSGRDFGGGGRDVSGPPSGSSGGPPPRSAPPRSRPEPDEESDLEDLPF